MENTKRSAKARRLQELEELLHKARHEKLRKALCITYEIDLGTLDMSNDIMRKDIWEEARTQGDGKVRELIAFLRPKRRRKTK